jgi:hypothetical protein
MKRRRRASPQLRASLQADACAFARKVGEMRDTGKISKEEGTNFCFFPPAPHHHHASQKKIQRKYKSATTKNISPPPLPTHTHTKNDVHNV